MASDMFLQLQRNCGIVKSQNDGMFSVTKYVWSFIISRHNSNARLTVTAVVS